MSGLPSLEGLRCVMLEVALALLPMAILFLASQALFLKLPWRKVAGVLKGLALTYAGLVLFLQGVYAGFMPVGEAVGVELGESLRVWALVPLGFVLGFVAVFAEPAVRIMVEEVERASAGNIPRRLLLYVLSLGVAVSVALSMARIIYGWPLAWFVVPGYLLAFLLAGWSKHNFIAIAFDSGGVATGPMTVTLILAVVIGVATAVEGRDPLTEGFGMIAMVALAPILATLFLGLLYASKERAEGKERG